VHHPFELIFVYLFFAFVRTNVFFIFSLNTKVLEIPSVDTDHAAYLLSNLVVFPVLIIYYLQCIGFVRNWSLKWLITVIFSFILGQFTLLQIDHEVLIQKKSFHPLWLFAIWAAMLLLQWGAAAIYRRILAKEGIVA